MFKGEVFQKIGSANDFKTLPPLSMVGLWRIRANLFIIWVPLSKCRHFTKIYVAVISLIEPIGLFCDDLGAFHAMCLKFPSKIANSFLHFAHITSKD